MFFIIFDHANACASMHLLVTSSTPTEQSQLTAMLKMKDSEDVLTIFEGTLENEDVNDIYDFTFTLLLKIEHSNLKSCNVILFKFRK